MDRPVYIDEKKVSEITGKSISTLRNDRHLGRGIPYIKAGRLVRYVLTDVYAWMEERKVQTRG